MISGIIFICTIETPIKIDFHRHSSTYMWEMMITFHWKVFKYHVTRTTGTNINWGSLIVQLKSVCVLWYEKQLNLIPRDGYYIQNIHTYYRSFSNAKTCNNFYWADNWLERSLNWKTFPSPQYALIYLLDVSLYLLSPHTVLCQQWA